MSTRGNKLRFKRYCCNLSVVSDSSIVMKARQLAGILRSAWEWVRRYSAPGSHDPGFDLESAIRIRRRIIVPIVLILGYLEIIIIVVMRNITHEHMLRQWYFGVVFTSSLFLGIALILVFWRYLGILQRRMMMALQKRQQAERVLQASEERFRTLTQMAPGGIYLTDIAGRFTYTNEIWCEMTGMTSEQALGDGWVEAIHPDDRDRVAQEWERLVAIRAAWDEEYRLKSPTGKETWVHGIASPLLADNGQVAGYVGINVDITDRKLTEAHQRLLGENLAHTQRLETIGRLAGGVAHDLNNMLTPILGYSEMLSDILPMGSAQRAQADEIIKASQRARDIVHQLLAFARKQHMALISLDLNQVLREFEVILRHTLRENIVIDFKLADLTGQIDGDAVQLEQIILNLALNAQDAMPTGGTLTIATRMVNINKHHAELHPGVSIGPNIMLEVSDTGTGMDSETIRLIFEPFFTTKDIGQGTGLGLASVHGIVLQLGGHIDVTSAVGKGSTFRIYFPLSRKPLQFPALQAQEAIPSPTTETILVAEDQSHVRQCVKTMLTNLGYHMLEAEDGQTALTVASHHDAPIHLLLTDIVMPGINGHQLFEQLAAIRPGLKVLYMSGYPSEVITKQGILTHGVNFISKPFSMGELSRKIKQALGARPKQS